MSTTADRAREKAERLAARQKERSRPADAATSVSLDEPAAADTRPVRITVDIAPPLHEAFDVWARQANRKHRLGLGIKADVLRVLIRRLMSDEDLQAEVIKTLMAERKK